MSTDQQSLGLAANLASGAEGETQRVSWRRWYMACLLTLLYIYAQIDSSAIILLVGPIKHDLGLTDTQMSLLLGLSFAAFYSILGLPAGYLVDRISRRGVMGVGIVLWSAMTMSCGLAHTYGQLFLSRCGVGIGEAAITPAAYSLIRDGFPPEKRGRAFGIFSAGSYIGAAAAVMLTGALLGLISKGALKSVPWVGGLHPWQAVLVVKQIFDVIRAINAEQKITVFLVEQNAHHALRLAHRGYVMQTGQIMLAGTGAELLADAHVRAAYLEGGA